MEHTDWFLKTAHVMQSSTEIRAIVIGLQFIQSMVQSQAPQNYKRCIHIISVIIISVFTVAGKGQIFHRVGKLGATA